MTIIDSTLNSFSWWHMQNGHIWRPFNTQEQAILISYRIHQYYIIIVKMAIDIEIEKLKKACHYPNISNHIMYI